MLNYIRAMTEDDNPAAKKLIIGQLKLTAHNDPCQQMYPSNGFELDGDGKWRWSSREIQVPSWLTLDYALPLKR